jgi:hypothetical protein
LKLKTRNDYAVESGRFFEVDYDLFALANKQRRLIDRFVLRPAIELTSYTCRAVIDWLDLEIEVGTPTQHQWVGRIAGRITGRRPFVEALNPGLGKAATEFRIRLQEPELASIRKLLAEIGESKGGVESAVLAGIEVSLDFYAKDEQELSRAKLYAVIARHLTFDILKMSNNARRPRSYGATGRTLSLVKTFDRNRTRMLQELEEAASDHPPALHSTFYIGEKDDPDIMLRLQHKVTDNRNPQAGTFDALDKEEKRVRLEVTLGGLAMQKFGLRTLNDLESFKFTLLQDNCFRFRLPTFGPLTTTPKATMGHIGRYQDRVRLQKFLVSGMIGLDALDGGRVELALSRRGEVRLHLKSMGKRVKRSTRVPAPVDLSIAWDEMMRKVEQALRHLGERVKVSI